MKKISFQCKGGVEKDKIQLSWGSVWSFKSVMSLGDLSASVGPMCFSSKIKKKLRDSVPYNVYELK